MLDQAVHKLVMAMAMVIAVVIMVAVGIPRVLQTLRTRTKPVTRPPLRADIHWAFMIQDIYDLGWREGQIAFERLATDEQRLAVPPEPPEDPKPHHSAVESRNVGLPGLWFGDLNPSVLALTVPPGAACAHIAHLQPGLQPWPRWNKQPQARQHGAE